AVLLRNGELVAAVEEERFRRVKHWAGFPRESIRACLEIAGISAGEVDHFAVSRNPRANLLRKTFFALRNRPGFELVRDRLKNRRRVLDLTGTIANTLGLDRERIAQRIHWVEHHPSHLASAFFVSPFDDAAVCAIDGFGDFVSTSLAVGRGPKLDVVTRVYFPHSLGLLYLALTQYLGFWKYGDEYKVMGLAPYGEPAYVRELRRLVHLKPDGGFELELPYFRHWSEGVSMTWDDGEPVIGQVYTSKLEELLGGPGRKPEEPLEPRHEAIAASLQEVFEEAAFHVLNGLYQKTRLPRLCLAGGCAMNSVFNGKIRERTPFKEIYVQPAAGDNGTALGAAFYVWHRKLGGPRRFAMYHAYWGPGSDGESIVETLAAGKAELDRERCATRRIAQEAELCDWAAKRLSEGKVLGWFQGRMEWGARALGNRSILADPRRPDMREVLNTKIKFREKFRPFAPSILEEALQDYFVGAVPDPFMMQVYPVRPEKRHVIPAVTHVDGSGRLQTVSRATNSLYWRLLKAFEKLAGVPVLLNTSFNENEPIVLSSAEALDCFLRTQMDALVLGSYVVEKARTQIDARAGSVSQFTAGTRSAAGGP
ncbi:MAG TPA: carbamoyltransferase C-terminal domain-containing protein, partial [Candidatus Binatia bacterium]|nr:carbamoyltransferase C-terminal domain-containing protein [Candidatus Binatia bacterium]